MNLDSLRIQIVGEVYDDTVHKTIYSTDASAYKESPLGVVFPKDEKDIKKIISFAQENKISLIPRTAGTSLAGQVVGKGLVVDTSRHLNQIIEINPEEKWIRVQPGVVLDELNIFCKPYGLFFAPETSTSNRCCVGGMVGNNSCGSHSLVYGSTREHLLEAKVVLSDGSSAHLRGLNSQELEEKTKENSLEGRIYRGIVDMLSDDDSRNAIVENYPDPSLTRRNTGYALDELLFNASFDNTREEKFNLCKLLAGSEGTLCIITELVLNLEPLPPKEKAVIALHCSSLEESFRANLVALEHKPVAIELIDGKILELSKQNISQNKNRFFIEGEPQAVLIIELAEESIELLTAKANAIIADLKLRSMGYHYPIIFGSDIARVWELRKAGLGLLSGMVGDAKPVSVVEDTAVLPSRLPAYMADFTAMMEGYGLSCVYHAHIATGELHLRPILNLKKEKDRELFREVAKQCALLVRKHRGSLSGEHGDGRLRGEFIPLLFGEKVFGLIRYVKKLWDEHNIFNEEKIVDSPPINTHLRYVENSLDFQTYFDYSAQGGYLRAIEQCNGSGDCRKSELFSGVMCPTYRATKDERFVTRARANILREGLLNSDSKSIFNDKDILSLLDSCISCKGCKSECPSNVDMTRYKAEYMQQHYHIKRMSLRTFLVANITNIHAAFSKTPQIFNLVAKNKILSSILKSVIGFAKERPLPTLAKKSLRYWHKHNSILISKPKGSFYLFADEFTNYMDVEVGKSFIRLFNSLGYQVIIPKHTDSGRAQLSKGLLKIAKKKANANIDYLKDLISEQTPLVGIEPSSLLSFRDEYPDLAKPENKDAAKKLAQNSFLYDEFFMREVEKGNISSNDFCDDKVEIKLHGHCHQKSLASIENSKKMLSLPTNYIINTVDTGCCGMAGSFGYEKEHYELSLQIGETSLFPEIRSTNNDIIISAPGTSCRHQIKDGTGRVAYHPVELIYSALKIKDQTKQLIK